MPVLEFFVGDSGKTWSVQPIGSDGKPEELIAGRAGLRDTTIARLSRDTVYPIRPGKTTLVMQFGDCDIGIPVEVFDRATSARDVTSSSRFVQAFALRANQGNAWPLRSGHFNIALRTPASEQYVDLRVTDAVCYPLRSEFRSISCGTTDSSVVVVSRRGRDRDTSMIQSELRIWEAPSAGFRTNARERERRRQQAEVCPWMI